MGRIFTGAAEGATLGGMIGTALGTILAGTTICIPGVNVATMALAAVTSVTVHVSGGAVGTLVGATLGGISGVVQDRH